MDVLNSADPNPEKKSSTPISELKKRISKDSPSKNTSSVVETEVEIIKDSSEKKSWWFYVQILAIVVAVCIILNFDNIKSLWSNIAWIGTGDDKITQIKIGLINGLITGFSMILGFWLLSK